MPYPGMVLQVRRRRAGSEGQGSTEAGGGRRWEAGHVPGIGDARSGGERQKWPGQRGAGGARAVGERADSWGQRAVGGGRMSRASAVTVTRGLPEPVLERLAGGSSVQRDRGSSGAHERGCRVSG